MKKSISDNNLLYLVKGGIPNVCHCDDPSFNAISIDLISNTGYIMKKGTQWKLYISGGFILEEYKHLCVDNKYYFYGLSFSDCCIELIRITAKNIDLV